MVDNSREILAPDKFDRGWVWDIYGDEEKAQMLSPCDLLTGFHTDIYGVGVE